MLTAIRTHPTVNRADWRASELGIARERLNRPNVQVNRRAQRVRFNLGLGCRALVRCLSGQKWSPDKACCRALGRETPEYELAFL